MTTEAKAIASVGQLFPDGPSAGPKRRYKTVTLPVSGYTLRIQSMTEKDYANYQACFLDKNGKVVGARLKQSNRIFISMCVVDDDGNRIITGDYVDRLEEWDAADTHYLYNECSKHAGISTDDIEGLVKNLEETRENSTPTS
jgi:hypothetical protein